jgi:hypothetical protein
MFDGIGDNTELWRGRAAFQASPPRPGDVPQGGEKQGRYAPPHANLFGTYLRYKTTLPLVPGIVLATVVAARRPEAAELLKEAALHWEKLRTWNARTRELAKTDIDEMYGLLADAAREFHSLLEAGLRKEATEVSKTMDFIERVLSDLPDYPDLDDAVIESARRIVAFANNAEPNIDYLVAGGITVITAGREGAGQLGLPNPSQGRSNHRIFDHGHPLLDNGGACSQVSSWAHQGFDGETGETCFTARGGRELGILLADLAKDGDVAVSVKRIAPHGYGSGTLDLRHRLAISRRAMEKTTVQLRAGMSPEEALILVCDVARHFEFPSWHELFFVSHAVSVTHVQDFIVAEGSVVFSYAPGSGGPDAEEKRLDERVLRLASGIVDVDVPLTGEIVADRDVAARLARRALRHARTDWAKTADPHRVRVSLTTEGSVLISAVNVCGTEPHYGIPYETMIRALRRHRDRFISRIHRHSTFRTDVALRQRSFSVYGRDFEVVLDPERCERTARAVLSIPADESRVRMQRGLAEFSRQFSESYGTAVVTALSPSVHDIDFPPFED